MSARTVVITILIHRNGQTELVTSIDRAWLNPGSGVVLWVDLAAPSIPESLILSDTFAFHPLSVEDAMTPVEYPKAEAYDGYLYIILHGIDFRAAEHGFATHDVDFFLGPAYLVGTMIEVPRGALTADQIATEAQFFSFGTNDLTQLTFGFSRDDAGKFLKIYQDRKILDKDPFASIDVEGVGQMVQTAVELGRKARKDLKLGICGEHGGDPASIHFFEKVGLDYVSMSPYRVPVARLAAAQAALAVKVGD